MYSRRQLRVRVLDALEQRVKQFAIREELWPLRVPHEALPIGELIGDVLGEEARTFDVVSLRSRTLLSLEWDDGSRWEVWVIVLPSKLKLFCDSSDDESRILASGGRNEGDESDRIFLELLADSGGEHFGIEMAGGPPACVRTSLTDRSFVVDLFLGLFEVSGMEGDVRRALAARGVEGTSAGPEPRDFREDVQAWLDRVTQPAGRRFRT